MKAVGVLFITSCFLLPNSHAGVFVDNFSGLTLDDTNYQTPPMAVNNAMFAANSGASRLELVASPPTTSFVGKSHSVIMNHEQTAAWNSNWSYSTDLFLASGNSLSSLGLGADDFIELRLLVRNSADPLDNLTFLAQNDAAGNRMLSLNQRTNGLPVSLGSSSTQTVVDASTAMTIGMSLSYDAASQQLTQEWTGLIMIRGAPMTSTRANVASLAGWGMNNSDTFQFAIQGIVSNRNFPNTVVGRVEVGDFTIENGNGYAYFDSITLATPEPGRAIFLGLFGLAWVLRRNRA